MLFIESPIFSKYVASYLSDAEYHALQLSLIDNPQQGTIVRGSGGVRKMRWAIKGKGKSGGVRIIYYVNTPHELWLITIYGKSDTDSIKGGILRKIKEVMEK